MYTSLVCPCLNTGANRDHNNSHVKKNCNESLINPHPYAVTVPNPIVYIDPLLAIIPIILTIVYSKNLTTVLLLTIEDMAVFVVKYIYIKINGQVMDLSIGYIGYPLWFNYFTVAISRVVV